MLNVEQQRVVDSLFPIVNIAGPGSGKTKTMLEKISIKLIDNKNDLKNLLILTFTNKAANSIFEKVENKLKKINQLEENEDLNKKEYYTGTFHSIFFKLLKENSVLLNQKFKFKSIISIMDSNEDFDLFETIFLNNVMETYFKDEKKMKKKDLDEKIFQIFGLTLKDFYFSILNSINKAPNDFKDILLTIHKKSNYYNKNDENNLNKKDIIEKIVKNYFNFKIKEGKLSFQDILLYFYMLLKIEPELQNKIKNQFKYVLVDEFQDTNPIESEIVDLIINDNDYVVGDPYQSIYKFLGANIDNILNRMNRKNMNVIQLLHNYRSSKNIVDFTNDITELFTKKIPNYKHCISSNDEVTNFPIYVKENVNQSFEIIKSIKERIKLGISINEIAILSRTNFETYELEKYLHFEKIPFKKVGGKGFYKIPEVLAVLNILRVLTNNYNVISIGKVLSLVKGIGDKTIETIIKNYINQKEISIENFFKIIEKSFPKNKNLLNLNKLIFNIEELNIEHLKKVLNHELFNIYEEFKKTKDTKEKKEIVVKNIDYILNEIEQILKKNSKDELEEYLNNVLLDSEKKEELSNEDKTKKEYLTLSTIHSAKGLEWNSCYILNTQEGKFPIFKSFDFDADLEEEKRLFYVAISRAKEFLMITSEGEINNFVKPFLNKKYIENYNTNNKKNNYDIWN